MSKRIRVLIVDDSALVRQLLSQGLSQDPSLEVIGAVSDPYQARDAIMKLDPDVLTLDVEMPRMSGLEFLKRLMPQYPLPVVMVSSLTKRGARTTLDALDAGAVDFVAKPKASSPSAVSRLMQELKTKIKIASSANVSHWKGKKIAVSTNVIQRAAPTGVEAIAIGASTGGTDATRVVLERIPRGAPPIVVVQHMPPGFTQMYAKRLNQQCPSYVCEGENGQELETGSVYIAPGGLQTQICRRNGRLVLNIFEGESVQGLRPSVDVLMLSFAEVLGKHAVGTVLTGIGRDGALGLKAMRDKGARCFSQDENTSIVFGMPREAYANGAAERLVPIDEMAEVLLRAKVGGHDS